MKTDSQQRFDHEKLDVYVHSVAFASWAGDLIEKLPSRIAAKDQLDRASTSIVLNIAEGSGKYQKPDRCRFLDMARRSAVESAAALDVLVARRLTKATVAAEGKDQLMRIVSMIVGLIKHHSPGRVYEDRAEYGEQHEHD